MKKLELYPQSHIFPIDQRSPYDLSDFIRYVNNWLKPSTPIDRLEYYPYRSASPTGSYELLADLHHDIRYELDEHQIKRIKADVHNKYVSALQVGADASITFINAKSLKGNIHQADNHVVYLLKQKDNWMYLRFSDSHIFMGTEIHESSW